jgi:hypothetical protein
MQYFLKRWRMALVAILAAFAVSVAFSGAASAEPNEANHWTGETVNNGQTIETRNTMGEARQGNNIIDVWRGATNNNVWISINHGNAFQIGSTTTFAAPTVVPWGSDRFMIFHVGTDNRIYNTWIDVAGNTPGSWSAVPGQTTREQVSVTQMGHNSFELYMVYRSSNDDRVWGTQFSNFGGTWPAAGNWGFITNINGGQTPSPPSVTFDPAGGRLWAVVRGEDNQIYMNSADADDVHWGTWGSQGGSAGDGPTIAATNNGDGDLLVAYRDTNAYVTYGLFNIGGTFTGWQTDNNAWQTFNPILLSVFGGIIYAIVTGLDNHAYWKQAYQR